MRRGFLVTGLLAVVAAMVATALGAALARALGVDFVVSEAGEDLPVSGIAFVTGVFSALGVVIAAALKRWSDRPARRFAVTAAILTALSLVPPFLSAADGSTVVALLALHLLAAGVVVPALVGALQAAPSGP